jgi:hypothetical protein
MPREEVQEEHVMAADSSSSEDELVRHTDEEGEGRTRRELVLLPLVHRVSTCEVLRVSLRFRFLTNAH